ncbi:MAG: hypothetical protein V1926_00150 [Candidatus Peregrinibacteria bacterium]
MPVLHLSIAGRISSSMLWVMSLVLCFLCFPFTVFAGPFTCTDGTIPAVEEVLGSDDEFLTPLPPVSDHFVRAVLERAQGMVISAETLAGTFDDSGFLSWLESAYKTLAGISDASLQIVGQEQDLLATTPCLAIDQLLLDAMVARIQCKIQKAFADRKSTTITALQDALKFVDQERRQLGQGARDHTFQDANWWQRRSFEPQKWCCGNADSVCIPGEGSSCLGAAFDSLRECQASSMCTERRMCPFDTNYLPPTVIGSGTTAKPVGAGYGCDVSVLETYGSLSLPNASLDDAIKKELESSREIAQKRDALISASESLKNKIVELENLMGRPLPREAQYFGKEKTGKYTHERISGCPAAEGTGTLIPLDSWPEGAARTETRGPFSLLTDNIRLLGHYLEVKDIWGQKRPYTDPFKTPEEFLPDNPTLSAQAAARNSIFDSLSRALNDIAYRPALKAWDRLQEWLEAAMVPKATDAPKQLSTQMLPLRAAVSAMATQGNSLNFGIRNFTRGLAYYLRRTCLTRPCNARLEQILKITLTNACFPYTDGGYLRGLDLAEYCSSAAGL